MNEIAVYLRMYADCLVKAAQAIRKNLWTLLLPVVLTVLVSLARTVLSPFGGLIGGIILGLVLDAIFSAYLYFLGELVCGRKVSLNEFKQSFGAYFWSVLNLAFVWWIAHWILGGILRGPGGTQLLLVTDALAFIAFNAVPEVLYQKGTSGGLQTLQESWSFLKENWLPWFIPNAPFILALLAFTGSLSITSLLGSIGLALVFGPLAHIAFVFRGFLFAALSRTSHRQRMFQYRNAR
jgi:hypothetical protein